MKLYTIGFTQKSAEQFFEAIKGAGIELLVDVFIFDLDAEFISELSNDEVTDNALLCDFVNLLLPSLFGELSLLEVILEFHLVSLDIADSILADVRSLFFNESFWRSSLATGNHLIEKSVLISVSCALLGLKRDILANICLEVVKLLERASLLGKFVVNGRNGHFIDLL